MILTTSIREESRQAAILSSETWFDVLQYLDTLRLSLRKCSDDIPDPEIPTIESSTILNNLTVSIPTKMEVGISETQTDVSERNSFKDIKGSFKNPIESINKLHECIQRLKTSKRLLEQIDQLRPLVESLISLYEYFNSNILILSDLLIDRLLDIVVEQLYGTKLRKHFVAAVLEIKRSVPFYMENNNFSIRISRRLDQTLSYVSKTNDNSLCYSSSHGEPFDRIAHNQEGFNPLLNLTKQIAIILEERHLFDCIFWLNFNQPGSIACRILEFFSSSLTKELLIRCSSDSSLLNQSRLLDHDLSIIVKTTSSFLSELFLKSRPSEPVAEINHVQELIESNYFKPLILNLFNACFGLLGDTTVPREVITVSGIIISSIISQTVKDRCIVLKLVNQLGKCCGANSKLAEYTDSIQCTELTIGVIQQMLNHWKSNLRLIPQLSLIRGFLVDLPTTTTGNTVVEGDELIAVLHHLHENSKCENMSERLYVIQSVLVWLSLIPMWIESKIVSEDQFARAIPMILEVSVSNWDVSFPALKMLGFTLWSELVEKCGNFTSVRNNASAELQNVQIEDFKLYELIYSRVLSLNASCRKLQYMALETLMTHLGVQWVNERQPFLIDHLLTSIGCRATRCAAFQFLTSFIRHCISTPPKSNNMYQTSTHPTLQTLVMKISSALLGISQPPDPLTIANTQSSILLLPDTQIDSEKFVGELSSCLVPMLGKQFPNILTLVLESMIQQRHHRMWSAAEASVILAARLNDRARWTSRDSGCDEISHQLEIWGTKTSLIRVSRERVMASMVHGDRNIRLAMIEMACTSRQNTAKPSSTDWLLARRICQSSLKGLMPEERAKTAASIRKFIGRVMESLRQRSGMKHNEISCLQLSVRTTKQNLISLHSDLKIHVQPSAPFDRSATALDILAYVYKLASTSELAPFIDRNDFFDFLYTQNEWNNWISLMNSNWDKQRLASMTILETFPFPPSLPIIEKLVLKSLLLLQGVKQREFVGGACVMSLLASICLFQPIKSNILSAERMQQAQQLCQLIEKHFNIAMNEKKNLRNCFSSSSLSVDDNALWNSVMSLNFPFSSESLATLKPVLFKYQLPLNFVKVIIQSIQIQLGMTENNVDHDIHTKGTIDRSLKPRSSSTSISCWTCHGLLNLLNQSLRLFPSCEKLFCCLAKDLETVSGLKNALQHDIKVQYARQICQMIFDISTIQWLSTKHVLGLLMDGVDSVLMNASLTAQAAELPNLSKHENMLNPAIQKQSDEPKFEENAHLENQNNSGGGDNHKRSHLIDRDDTSQKRDCVISIDCRGHPILSREVIGDSNDNEMEEDGCLLGSWITVKEGALCLRYLLDWFDIDLLLDGQNTDSKEGSNDMDNHKVQDANLNVSKSTCLSPTFFDILEYRLLALLLGIKHPAAMDKLFNSTLSLNKRLLLCCKNQYRELPSRWLTRLFNLVKATPESERTAESFSQNTTRLSLPPPLRRSYSLGLAFLSIITADTTKYLSTDFVPRTMNFLLDSVEVDEILHCAASNENETYSLFVHTLNILRCIVRSTALVMPCAEYFGRILAVAVRFLSHPKWAVRNAANLLFSAILDRTTGSNWNLLGEDFGADANSAQISFGDAKGFSLCTNGPQRELQSKKARQLVDLLRLHPPLIKLISERLIGGQVADPISEGVTVALLLFLSRVLLNGPTQEDLEDEITDLFKKVKKCLYNSPSYHARVMASRTVVTTVIYQEPPVCQQPMSTVLLRLFDSGLYEAISTMPKIKESSNIPHLVTVKVHNNALHGTLITVLEFCCRPTACHAIINEHLSSDEQSILMSILQKLERIIKLPAAPLCKALTLQCVERLVIGLSHLLIANEDQQKIERRDALCKWSKNFAFAQLPLRIQSRLSSVIKEYPLVSNPSPWDKLMSNIPTEVSAIRLLLLCEFEKSPSIITALLTPQIKTDLYLKDGEDVQSISATLLEALRISSKLFHLLISENEDGNPTELPVYPFISTATFLVKIEPFLDVLVDALSNFINVISNHLSGLENAKELSQQSSDSLFIIMDGHITNTALVDLGRTGAKLLVAVLTLKSERRTAVEAIHRLIVSLRLRFPNNPCILQSSVVLGARLKTWSSTVSHNEWLEALQKAGNPIADVHVRFSVLRALKVCGLDSNELEPWKRALVLAVDEIPEIQEEASSIICKALKKIHSNTSNPQLESSDETLHKQFINEVECCSTFLPNTALRWGLRYIVSFLQPRDFSLLSMCSQNFPNSLIGNWFLTILAGRSNDFNIFPDLAIGGSEWLLSVPQEERSDEVLDECASSLLMQESQYSSKCQLLKVGRAEVFDQEPSNIFNEDQLFIQLFGELYMNLPNNKMVEFTNEREINEVSKQLQICSKLCQIGSDVSIGHVTRSPSVTATLKALIIRAAITVKALFSNSFEIPNHLKINIDELVLSVKDRSGVDPLFIESVEALQRVTTIAKFREQKHIDLKLFKPICSDNYCSTNSMIVH